MTRFLPFLIFALLLAGCGTDTPETGDSENDGESTETSRSTEIRNADASQAKSPLELGTVTFKIGDQDLDWKDLDRYTTELKIRDNFVTLVYQEADTQKKLFVAFRNVDTHGNLAGDYDVSGASRNAALANVTAMNVVGPEQHVTMGSGQVKVESIDSSGACKLSWEGTGYSVKDIQQQYPLEMSGSVDMTFHSVVDTRSEK